MIEPKRKLKVVKANETPTAKHYRLAVAMFREFVKEFPDKATEIVREMLPSVVK